MGQILLILLAITTFTFTTRAQLAVASTDLSHAFQSALKQSETLASQERLVLIAEEHYAQAKGSILPNLAVNASYAVQDSPADPLAATFFPRFQPELKLTLRQPIFRGLREFAALRQTKNTITAEKYARENATQLLYSDVSKSYHAVLATEENYSNIQEQIRTYDERIEELNRRVREGTSNQTDLLAVQTSRATLKSQLRTAQASISGARESFAFLTGLPSDTKLARVLDPMDKPKLRPLEEYLKSIEDRPDLRGLVGRVQTAEDQVSIAKGAHAPSIDLVGNYYLKRQSDIYRGINWDIQAVLSFPLFAGGTITSQVNEAAFQKERTELELTRLRRQAEQQTRTLYSEYETGLESISDLEESLGLAEKKFQLLKRDFSRGLSRNLDVLQALISAHEIRRELLRARYVARDKWIELNITSGRPSIQ